MEFSNSISSLPPSHNRERKLKVTEACWKIFYNAKELKESKILIILLSVTRVTFPLHSQHQFFSLVSCKIQLGQSFSALAILIFGAGWLFVWGCPICCKLFASTPGLYLPDASGFPSSSYDHQNVSRLPSIAGQEKSSTLKNHGSRLRERCSEDSREEYENEMSRLLSIWEENPVFFPSIHIIFGPYFHYFFPLCLGMFGGAGELRLIGQVWPHSMKEKLWHGRT